MNRSLAVALLALGFALAAPSLARAGQQPAGQATAPDQTPTARFTAFFADVLAGRVPSTSLTPEMKAGLTSELLSQLSAFYATFGTFQKLEFVDQDIVQGYQRYHYVATFDKGTQGVMFVTDASGAIAGFFKDQSP